MQEKFGEVTTISRVGVLRTDSASDYGEFYDNSGELLLRFAIKKNALSMYAQKAQEMKKSGKWSSAHPMHTFRHEIGHAIQLEHRLNDSSWNDKLEKITDIMGKVNPEYVSLYGFTTLDEFISECVAESMTKKARTISKQDAKIIIGGLIIMTDAFFKYMKYSHLVRGKRIINDDTPMEIKEEVRKLDTDYFVKTGRHMIIVPE